VIDHPPVHRLRLVRLPQLEERVGQRQIRLDQPGLAPAPVRELDQLLMVPDVIGCQRHDQGDHLTRPLPLLARLVPPGRDLELLARAIGVARPEKLLSEGPVGRRVVGAIGYRLLQLAQRGVGLDEEQIRGLRGRGVRSRRFERVEIRAGRLLRRSRAHRVVEAGLDLRRKIKLRAGLGVGRPGVQIDFDGCVGDPLE
jgi:hypothetical protein